MTEDRWDGVVDSDRESRAPREAAERRDQPKAFDREGFAIRCNTCGRTDGGHRYSCSAP